MLTSTVLDSIGQDIPKTKRRGRPNLTNTASQKLSTEGNHLNPHVRV